MCHVNSHYLLKHQHSALIDKKHVFVLRQGAISVPGKNHFKYFLLKVHQNGRQLHCCFNSREMFYT